MPPASLSSSAPPLALVLRVLRVLRVPSRTTLLVLFGALTVLGLVGVGRWRYRLLHDAALREWQSEFSARLQLIALMVDRWVYDQRAGARAAAISVGQALGAAAPELAKARRVAGAIEATRLQQDLVALWVVDSAGRILAASKDAPTLTALESAMAASAIRRRTEFLLGPILPPAGASRTVVATLVPGRSAALLYAVDPNHTLFPLLQSESGTTRTVRTKLFERRDSRVRVLNPTRYQAAEAFGLELPDVDAPLLWRRALGGGDTSGVFHDRRGVPVVATTYYLDEVGWGLMRAVNADEAFADATARFRAELIALAAVAGMALTVVLAWHLYTLRRRRTTDALRQHESRLRLYIEQMPAILWTTDRALRFTSAQGAALATIGLTTDVGRGRPAATVFDGERECDEFLHLHHAALAGRSGTAELTWRDRAFHMHVEPLRDADGRPSGTLGLALDVTDRRALEERLLHQAYHDALTGLPNRAHFLQRVMQALTRGVPATAEASGTPAVLFIDLDNFKAVNDSLGHAAGDRLLATAAERLRGATRGCDTVARLGGDEFAVLLDHLTACHEATVVAERILKALRAPIRLETREVFVGASIGIACLSREDPTHSADTLLREADAAMYHAKRRGGHRFEVFDPSMRAHAVDRLELKADLRRAVERQEFTLHYQPIVHLEDGRVAGMEALLRWHHPQRGPLSPATFIPLAEETGLIVPLGRWVLGEACRQAQRWRERFPQLDPFTVSVNLSARQLQDAAVVDDVRDALAASGLPSRCLTLEITESVIMQDATASLATLRELKALGIRLALDDFGTGYSSLSYLKRFPIDVLKIDRSFVDGITAGGTDVALTHAIIALGKTLSLLTVAEGVETAAQRDQLAALGCDFGQGYGFARPMSPGAMVKWLAEHGDGPASSRQPERPASLGVA